MPAAFAYIKVKDEGHTTSPGLIHYLRWPGMGALGAVYIPFAPLVIVGRVGRKVPPGMGRTGAAYDGTGKSCEGPWPEKPGAAPFLGSPP
jgi:hypothetical protein